jgi:two-component system, OmpR family, sensor histidine kinase QseC
VETEEFMSVAVHDLRNPIAVVRASAQMAQRQLNRGDAAGTQNRLKSIVEQTERLTDMLEAFLDAARIGTGQLALRTEHIDLRELVDVAFQGTQPFGGDQLGRSLEVSIPDGCIGAWDRQRMLRAVRALLSNALLYGDPVAPVRVSAQRAGDRVRVVVSGGGPGPDAEEVEHLFERFYRGKSAAEAGQSGSGLGLFTARGIARMHGGDLRRLEGDRFELELPLVQ